MKNLKNICHFEKIISWFFSCAVLTKMTEEEEESEGCILWPVILTKFEISCLPLSEIFLLIVIAWNKLNSISQEMKSSVFPISEILTDFLSGDFCVSFLHKADYCRRVWENVVEKNTDLLYICFLKIIFMQKENESQPKSLFFPLNRFLWRLIRLRLTPAGQRLHL